MASKSKPLVSVSASTLRSFWQERPEAAAEFAAEAGVGTNSVLGRDGDTSRIRGRINPAFYSTERASALLAQNGMTYGEKSEAETKTVSVPRVSPKTGRAVKPTVLPLAEARTLAGAKAKGRLSSANLARIAEVLTEQGR